MNRQTGTNEKPIIHFSNTASAICVFLLLLLLSPLSHAQDGSNYTNVERVGFAFYKLGDIEPDFDSWIKGMPEYKKIVRPRERAEFLSKMKFRLEQGLNTYVPEFDMITITTPVILQGMPAENFSRANERYIRIYPDTKNNTRDFYFPIPVGKQWVALIPRDIEKHQLIKVSPEKYDQIIGTTSMSSSEGIKRTGIMEIVIQPTSVDTKEPLIIKNIELWLMDGEMASLSVWTDKKHDLAWEYTAPWYVSDTQRGLYDLYGK